MWKDAGKVAAYFAVFTICVYIGQWFRGPVENWNDTLGLVFISALGLVWLGKVGKHIDSLDDRIRYLEQMTGHQRPKDTE